VNTVFLVLVLVVVAAAVLVGWLAWTAERLYRMHLRCERSEAALAAALADRRALVLEAATSAALDPPTIVLLVDAASFDAAGADSDYRAAGEAGSELEARWQRESQLSEVLRAVWPLEDAGNAPWNTLAAAANRLSLARRIHNDLVASCLGLRSRRRVRWFRLVGHADAPAMVAFDDAPP